jgi:YVTN family beta-propeller protein
VRLRPTSSLLAVCALLITSSNITVAADSTFKPTAQLRRPGALVVGNDHAFVANRKSGTVSVINLKTKSVESETLVGRRLSDLVGLPTTNLLVALDDDRHQLILLQTTGSKLRVVQRLDVPHSPVRLQLSTDGKLCAVTSLWSRRVTLIDLQESNFESQAKELILPKLTVRKTLDMPFAPRLSKFLADDKRLIVTDAFGGNMAVIDVANRKLLSRPTLAGHNIRGLAIGHGGRELHVTHQSLNGNSTTTHENVFWGGVMKNFVRSIPLDQLLTSINVGNPPDGSLYPLGHPSGATADPGAMLVTPRGEAALLLTGVNEIALRRRPREPFVRRKVGQRPTAICLSTDEQTIYVANTFDDSISQIDLDTLKVTATISLGPQPKLTSAERGERLFFDARLSLDGWYSCHSCHTDGHTNGLLNDNFGDNYFGDPKLVPSLLGVGQTHPWAWNGKAVSLDKQIVKSITVTMQGEKPSEQTVHDLTAYIKTLEPPPGLAVARGNVDQKQITAGRLVFQKRGCVDCHAAPKYTTGAVYDVGLADKSGNKEFNPPSLLGVSQRGPFFHDGRATTLRDVLTRFKHSLEQPLDAAELQAILAFLKSL